MRPVVAGGRSPLIAVALTALGGACAAGCAAASMGTSGAGGHGGSGGDGGPQCQINLSIVDPAGATALPPAGDNVNVSVRGTANVPLAAGTTWLWRVTFADGSPVTTAPVSSGDMALIAFPVARAGTYTVHVDATSDGSVCEGEEIMESAAVGALTTSFRFRFVPPPTSNLPVQEQQIPIKGGTPSNSGSIFLTSASPVPLQVHDTNGAAVPSYVRINETATQRLAVEAHTPSGGGPIDLQLLPNGSYDVLVVPDGDIAPILMTGQSPAALPRTLNLVPGVAISGRVTDGATPIAGAWVALHAGSLPSTLAMTGPDGRFTLHAAAGKFTATITQTLAQGILEATLPVERAVMVDATPGATAPTLEVAIHPPKTTGSLGLHFTAAPSGAGLASGSKVVLQAADLAAGAASVSVNGGPARVANVRFRAELTPQLDAGGAGNKASVSIAGIPAAPYTATVFPATADGPDAITKSAIDLSSGVAPQSPMEITLGGKVPLAGTLTPEALTAGVLVTAVDVEGDFPSAIAAQSMTGGVFMLQVSPGRKYGLRAQPTGAQALARALFGPVTVDATGTTLGAEKMQGALLFGATLITGQMKGGVGGVLVQVFCLPTSASCDPGTAIAETISRSDGYFQVTLPDPGVSP